MRFTIHVTRMLTESVRYAVSTRRISIVAVIVLGLILVALSATAQVVAPLALYPFA